MTRRWLPVEEWRTHLDGTELESVWPYLNPRTVRIEVVEDRGAVVGCWAFVRYMHAEGIWVDPGHRARSVVARHHLAALYETARDWSEPVVLTAAVSDDVRSLIERLQGQRLPGDHYVIPTGIGAAS